MSLVNFELNGQVATITLNHGKVNAFSFELIEDVNKALDKAEEAKACVVLAGNLGVFSAGFYLPSIMESGESRANMADSGLSLIHRLMAFPTPVVAACTGHALAYGAVVLLGCDYRIGAKGDFKIGLNEVAIGVALSKGVSLIARERIARHHISQCAHLAELQTPEESVVCGYLDQVVELNDVLATAQKKAQYYADSIDIDAFAETKLSSREDFLAQLKDYIQQDRQNIIDCFKSDATQAVA